MKDKKILIAAVDLMLLFVIMFLVAIISNYYAEKGIKDRSALPIFITKPTKSGYKATFSSYTSIIPERDKITISKVVNDIIFKTIKMDRKEKFGKHFLKGERYVVYKIEDSSENFHYVIDFLINEDKSFFIMK